MTETGQAMDQSEVAEAPATEVEEDLGPGDPHGKTNGRLPVIEVFGPTIQGEGALIGQKCHFIRLGGCDFRCKMCDSLHAVLPHLVKKNAKWMTWDEITEVLFLLGEPVHTPWIVLSGGNPAMWDCGRLVSSLQNVGYKVALETQGSLWQYWVRDVDCVTVSPKGPGMGEKFNPGDFEDFIVKAWPNWEKINVKIVVFDQRDLEFAKEVHAILDRLFFPPDQRFLSLGNSAPPVPGQELDDAGLEDGLLAEYALLLEDYFKEETLSQWRFLPQLHVLLYGNRQGV